AYTAILSSCHPPSPALGRKRATSTWHPCLPPTLVVDLPTRLGVRVTKPRLTKLELQIMDALWTRGALSVREIQEAFAEKNRPAYTTVQTMVYRLEAKKAIRRVKKIGNAYIFAALISRPSAQRRLIDVCLGFFGARPQPLVAHLIESGRLTLEDVEAARHELRRLA